MRGLQKSKSVSWATEGLCQVRLFLSEDTPSQVGINTQDHLQPKKKTQFLYSNTGAVPSGQAVPPGFEGVNPETQFLKNKLAQFPLAKWKCPPRFLLDDSWRITAGEGSQEVEIENQRELRVFEAIYPRPSAIPPNPAVSPEAETILHDDSRTPLVPISAIEDEDPSEDFPNGSTCEYGSSSIQTGALEDCAQQPQLLAAASAALSALISGEGGPGLIDHDLLLKILSNPAILEEFKKRQFYPQQANTNPNLNPNPPVPPVIPYHQPPFHSVAPPQPPKDMSYYKNLIQQHGADQEVTPMGHHGGPVDSVVNATRPVASMEQAKPRFMKPCVYFNSSKGCRNGANCSFVHEEAGSVRAPGEFHGVKRMKMSNREMASSQPFS